ncbi:MAG: hypothetical protein ABR971_03290 [Acidobacteriaceae bacterium]
MNTRSGRGRQALSMVALFLVAAPFRGLAQTSCPVALVSAKVENDTIQVEFRNKGKVPIEQLSLACSPAPKGAIHGAPCHVETGIFYPSSVGWLKIEYPNASRHPIEISITQLRMAGGTLWQPGASSLCKPRRTTKN